MVSAPGGFALLVPGLPFTFQVAFSRSLTRLSFLTSKVGIISRSPSWLSKDVKALSKSVASRAIHSFQKHLHKIYGKLSPRNEAGREWKFEILHWREGGIVCRKGRIVNIRGLVGFRRDSSMRPKAAKTTVQGWRWLCPKVHLWEQVRQPRARVRQTATTTKACPLAPVQSQTP